MRKTALTFVLAGLIPFASHQALADVVLGSDIQNLTVFSETTTTVGVNSTIVGNVMTGGASTISSDVSLSGSLTTASGATTIGANTVIGGTLTAGGTVATGDSSHITGDMTISGTATIGASTHIDGNMASAGGATIGASANILGTVKSGGAVSIGASSTVAGVVGAVGTVTVAAGATTGGIQTLSSSPVDATASANQLSLAATRDAQEIANARRDFSNLGTGSVLSPTIITDETIYSGVYSATSLTTTAGTTITLDGRGLANQSWVFNIANGLTLGAATNIVLENVGDNSSVYWNTGDSTNIGASSAIVGKIFADNFIIMGANSRVNGAGSSGGGVYSQSSYITTGTGVVIAGMVSAAPAPMPGLGTSPFALLMVTCYGGYLVRRRRA